MKLLIILVLLTGCSMFSPEPEVKPEIKSVTEKLEDCVHLRIQDGVQPLDSLQICDTIYRGRK